MAVFRVNKDKQNPYMMINKSFIYDPRLSLKAKGLMSYFLSRPDDWEFYQTEIKKHTTDRDRAISSAIQELITCGYIKRSSKRGEYGKFKGGYDYEVYETPTDIESSPKLQNAEPAKCQNGEMPNRQNDVLLSNKSLLNNDFKLNNEFNNKNKKIENPLTVYQNNIFPTPGEIDIESINSWTERLGADIVIYAINIAAKANARRLNYIEKILMDWERNGIATLEQAQAYTSNRNKKKTSNANVKKEKVDSFNNYEQRDYDFVDLEKKLLGWDQE